MRFKGYAPLIFSAVYRMEPFRIPPFPLREMPNVHVFVRGTSTEFSREGSRDARAGFFAQEDGKRTREASPIYWIPPTNKPREEWLSRAEATFHAAVERALNHSKLAWAEFAPEHLPALFVSIRPGKPVELDEYGRGVHQYEEALVNGEARKTFYESFVGKKTDVDAQERSFRVELTRKEYEELLKRIDERARHAGFAFLEPDGKIKDFYKDWERGWDLVKALTGRLPHGPRSETGMHASSPEKYLIGEHVKEVLLAKAYRELTQNLKEPFEA